MIALLTLFSALQMAPAAAGDTIRINCGSTQPYSSADGRVFGADQYFAGGQVYANPAIADILGTTDDELYRTERFGTMRYEIPVPAGEYLVRLHLAEIYYGATGGPAGYAGQRVFTVKLENRRVITNHDVYTTAGPMSAVVKEARTVVSDGFVSLDFVNVVDAPAIKAIEVLRQPAGSTPAGCAWTSRAAVALERKEGQCAVVNGELYTFGGYYTGLNATAQTQRYNLATDQWTTLAPMPQATTHTAAVADGPQVWIIGGFVGNYPGVVTDAVWVYDTQTNTWRAGPALPQQRGAGTAARLGRRVHYFGGVEPNFADNSPLHFVLDLDNEAAGWQLAAPLPLPRCHLASASRGGKIYALAGQYTHTAPVNTPLVHEYDPLSDTWTRRADFPTVRSHFETSVDVLDGRIITVGGYDGYTNYEDVLAFDPDLNQWTQICQLPLTLGSPSAKLLGTTLVVAQGESDNQPGPDTATRSTVLSSTPSNILRFSRTQLTAQVAPGGTATMANMLWTLSGTAAYTLAPSTLPGWLTLSAGNGNVGPLGRDISFQVDAAGLAAGTYTATVQATAPGYTTTSATVVLTVNNSLATTATQAMRATLAPNPTTNSASLRFDAPTGQQAQLALYDSRGRLVWQGGHAAVAGRNEYELPTAALAPGLYMLRLQLLEGVRTVRLLKY